jgi:hypothetical protein
VRPASAKVGTIARIRFGVRLKESIQPAPEGLRWSVSAQVVPLAVTEGARGKVGKCKPAQATGAIIRLKPRRIRVLPDEIVFLVCNTARVMKNGPGKRGLLHRELPLHIDYLPRSRSFLCFRMLGNYLGSCARLWHSILFTRRAGPKWPPLSSTDTLWPGNATLKMWKHSAPP